MSKDLKKIVITCDHIIQKDHSLEIVELLCTMYDNAEIYTLVHKQGEVIGPIEHRKITSSFLSNIVNTESDFSRWKFLVPSAAKGLSISCEVDLIINVTNGLSHGIRKCAKTKLITYFYNNKYFDNKEKGLLNKFFKSYISNYMKENLEQSEQLWASSSILKEKLDTIVDNKEIEVIWPFIKINDFNLVQDMSDNDYFVVNTDGLDSSIATRIVFELKKYNIKTLFYGNNQNLLILESDQDISFVNKKCNSSLNSLLQNSLGLIDLSDISFPKIALSALATGRKVICKASKFNKEYLDTDGVYFCNKITDIHLTMQKVLKSNLKGPQDKMRGHAMKFNEVKFKSTIKRKIDQLL